MAEVVVRRIEIAPIALKRRGRTILRFEQNLAFALRAADRVPAIEDALVVAEALVGDSTETKTETRLSRHIAR